MEHLGLKVNRLIRVAYGPFQLGALGPGQVDEVYNLACAASPPQYQADPMHTMMTNVLGTGHLLELARVKGARFLQASTSVPVIQPLSSAWRP